MLNAERARDTVKMIRAVKPPPPDPTHHGRIVMPHGDLLDEIFRAAKKRGWDPQPNPAAHLWRCGADLIASVCIHGPKMPHRAMAPVLSLAASNAMRRRLAFFAGVYEPGGAAVFARWHGPKYEWDFNLKTAVSAALDAWDEEMTHAPGIVLGMNTTEITVADARARLSDAVAERYLNREREIVALGQFMDSDQKTEWSLMRAFWVARGMQSPANFYRSPSTMLDDLHDFYVNVMESAGTGA